MDKMNQVCTKEQAIKMKELGFIQESLFYVHINLERTLFIKHANHCWQSIYADFRESDVGLVDYMASAFTVAELGGMLPAGYDSMNCTNEGWRCYDLLGVCDGEVYPTEAESRAAMLIRLVTDKWEHIDSLNERLR